MIVLNRKVPTSYSRFASTARRFFLLVILVFICLPALGAETYRVGPGDVLNVDVYDHEDLSSVVRVGGDGTIPMPLIGSVQVNGMSVEEIALVLEKGLGDGYIIAPHVNVFVKNFEGHKAVILGEVNKPGMVELRGTTTLLEVISKAGGLTDYAGDTAKITSRNAEDGSGKVQSIDLKALLKQGNVRANIIIQDGDNIFVEKVGQYYIMGEIHSPGSFLLNEKLTVIDAVNRAGGFTSMAAENDIEIQRMLSGQRTTLKDVDHEEVLMENDVIIVPESFF